MKMKELRAQWEKGLQDGFNNLSDRENQNPLYWRAVSEGDRRYRQWLAEGRFDEKETFEEAFRQVQEDYRNPVGFQLLSAAFAV